MAANQKRAPLHLGFLPPSPISSTLSQALNASPSSLMLALGFRLDQAKTLSKVQVYASAVNNAGSIGPNDLTCDVYSSSGGQPNASLQSVNTVTSTIATGWVEFTGFTYSLSAGTQYWLVLKNNNGTPTSNYPTYQWGGAGTSPAVSCGNTAYVGWSKWQWGGSSWTTGQGAVCGYRLQFSDGTYDGLPPYSIATGSDRAYGGTPGSGNEVGVQFTIPTGTKYNVRGLAFFVSVNGSPTGNLLFRLYQNGTLAATTLGIINSDALLLNGSYVADYFSSDVTLNPSDVVTCTIADSADSAANHAYAMAAEYKFASDANTQALMPFEGTLKKVTSSNAGGASTPTFSQTNTSIFPFALLLDSAGEFAATGGGGVPRIGPGLIGGICG